jgi:hypothetical protein
VLRLAGEGEASVRGVAALPGGGAIAVGRLEGRVGGLALAAAGPADGFVIGLSPSGRIAWTAALGGAGDADLTAAAGGAGLAVAGTAAGRAELGGRAAQAEGQPAALVARLDPRGAPLWLRAIGATGYAVPAALAWTADGDLIVAGYYAGTLDPSGAALAAAGSLDVWVARLAGADGKTRWLHRAGGPGADAARAVAVTERGDVLVAGSFHRFADFSSSTLHTADETADPFVARVGDAGFAWARAFPADGDAVARGLSPAPGGAALAVTFTGVLHAGGVRLEAGDQARGAVALLDASGQVAWTRMLDGARSADAVAVAGDSLLVTGASADSTGSGYVAALSLAGAPRWRITVDAGAPAAIATTPGRTVIGGPGFAAAVRSR